MKHVTVDVIDARFGLGERLPVTIALAIQRADSGETVVEATAPAMYAPGHGYHFGDNYVPPSGAAYDWTFTISPVEALRQEGTEDLWLEPVEWRGSFTLDAEECGRESDQPGRGGRLRPERAARDAERGAGGPAFRAG